MTFSATAKTVSGPQSQASGSSFYSAMRLLPKSERSAMFAIYAFCREVDDIADEIGPTPEEQRAQLDVWRRAVDSLYTGGPTSRVRDLAGPTRAYHLAKEDFVAVLDGMAMDIDGPIRRPSFETFDLYCDRVAGAVGRLSVKVFGMDEAPGKELAHHLGRAPARAQADERRLSDDPEAHGAQGLEGAARTRVAQQGRPRLDPRYPRPQPVRKRACSLSSPLMGRAIACGEARSSHPYRHRRASVPATHDRRIESGHARYGQSSTFQPRLKCSALAAPGAATRRSVCMGGRDLRPAMTFVVWRWCL